MKALLLPGFCLLFLHALNAQDLQVLKDRLQHASADTAIDDVGLAPWHLKLDVQLLATPTQKAEQGTIEEWWQGPDTYRIQYALPSYNATILHSDAGHFQTHNQDTPPQLLLNLLDQVVRPVDPLREADLGTAEARRKSFGKVTLDCIMLSKPLKPNGDSHPRQVTQVPLGLFPTYCFDPGSSSLRVTFSLGAEAAIRNGVGTFQKRSVATSATLYDAGLPAATYHVLTLRSGETPPAGTFQPSPDLVEPEKAATIAGGVLAGSILHKTIPIYPDSAKQNHIYGSVVLHVIIGRDGHIHQMHLVSAPDGDLALSALDAVRSWTYKPYLLNGVATEVDSTITVNYAIGN